MKITATLAACALLVFQAGAGSPTGVVQWSIERGQLSSKMPLQKWGSTWEEALTNEKRRGGYFAACSVGSPPQNVTLHLDTGSSDIWVPDSAATVCRGERNSPQGCTFGAFDPTLSQTFRDIDPGQFSIRYVDGSHSDGDYFVDAFALGGATVGNLTMGLGRETDIPYGLAGIGYSLGEVAGAAYPNLPAVMLAEGLINTVAYSLWLNDLAAQTGSILFGGVDTAKYVGNLTRIGIERDDQTGAFTAFRVALTSLDAVGLDGIGVGHGLTSREFPLPVVLDSGTTLSYLPTDLALQVWEAAGAVYSRDVGLAAVPCDVAGSGGLFSFGFSGAGGPHIDVGMDELVLSLSSGSGDVDSPPLVFASGPYAGRPACEFGIQNISASGPFILGDTFLRSAYVVYDLANNEVGIAPTDFNATDSNVVAFSGLSAHIPGATPAPSLQDVTPSPSPSLSGPSPTATPATSAVSSGSFSRTTTPSTMPTPTPMRSHNSGTGRDGDAAKNIGVGRKTSSFYGASVLVLCVSIGGPLLLF